MDQGETRAEGWRREAPLQEEGLNAIGNGRPFQQVKLHGMVVRTSRRRRRSSYGSSVVRPAVRPASMCSWRIYLRSEQSEAPMSFAVAQRLPPFPGQPHRPRPELRRVRRQHVDSFPWD